MLQLVIDMGFHKLAHSVMDLKTVKKKLKSDEKNSNNKIQEYQAVIFWYTNNWTFELIAKLRGYACLSKYLQY